MRSRQVGHFGWIRRVAQMLMQLLLTLIAISSSSSLIFSVYRAWLAVLISSLDLYFRRRSLAHSYAQRCACTTPSIVIIILLLCATESIRVHSLKSAQLCIYAVHIVFRVRLLLLLFLYFLSSVWLFNFQTLFECNNGDSRTISNMMICMRTRKSENQKKKNTKAK